MKNQISLSLFFGLLLTTTTHAGYEGGGGDPCENRIKIIRDDLKNWINEGGPKGLSLNNNLSATEYSKTMLAQIDLAKIKCVSQNDPGFPVLVNGTPKVCRFDNLKAKKSITCDFLKFQELEESEQYKLIHHEYAGLSRFEKPKKDDSNYAISNQISEYLVNEVVKKLSVKSSQNSGYVSKREFKISPPTSTKVGDYAIAWGIPGMSLDFEKIAQSSHQNQKSFIEKYNKKIKNFVVSLSDNKVLATIESKSWNPNEETEYYINENTGKNHLGLSLHEIRIESEGYHSGLVVIYNYMKNNSSSNMGNIILFESNNTHSNIQIDAYQLNTEIQNQIALLIEKPNHLKTLKNKSSVISLDYIAALSHQMNIMTYSYYLPGSNDSFYVNATMELTYENGVIHANVFSIEEINGMNKEINEE